jgi:hypothetical protein
MNVKVYMMKSGEQIMGSELQKDDKHLVVRGAARVVATPDGLKLVPYMLGIGDLKGDTTFDVSEIVACSEQVNSEALSNWNEKYGNGIVTPPKQDLVLNP